MPKPKKKSTAPSTLSDQIRDVIVARKLSGYAVAQAAEVDPSVVTRFLTRDRSLTLATAEKIAAALGLYLTEGRGGLR